jgi:hypothetical protein
MAGPGGTPGAVSQCCYQHAVSDSAVFCGDCGKPLLRCMAFKECGGLVGEDGLCAVCVKPQLFLDKDAVTDVKAGGVLVLPLVFYNGSTIARPLMITDVWMREGGGERRRLEVPWKRLDPRGHNSLSVQTGAMERQGRYGVEIAFAAATNYLWREERFAFVSSLNLDIEQGGSMVINQTINTQGSGHGSDTVYAPIRLEQVDRSRRPGGGTQDSGGSAAAELGLQRADNLEIEKGVRGYSAGQLKDAVVSRAAKFIWKGFAANDAPGAGPIVTKDGVIAAGRAKTITDGGEGHVRLLVTDATGALDEQLSRAISRRHIEFFVQSGRLCLRAIGEAGVIVDNRKVSTGSVEQIDAGETIKVLPKYGEALALQVRMRAYYGRIDEITISRIPPMPEASSR